MFFKSMLLSLLVALCYFSTYTNAQDIGPMDSVFIEPNRLSTKGKDGIAKLPNYRDGELCGFTEVNESFKSSEYSETYIEELKFLRRLGCLEEKFIENRNAENITTSAKLLFNELVGSEIRSSIVLDDFFHSFLEIYVAADRPFEALFMITKVSDDAEVNKRFLRSKLYRNILKVVQIPTDATSFVNPFADKADNGNACDLANANISMQRGLALLNRREYSSASSMFNRASKYARRQPGTLRWHAYLNHLSTGVSRANVYDDDDFLFGENILRYAAKGIISREEYQRELWKSMLSLFTAERVIKNASSSFLRDIEVYLDQWELQAQSNKDQKAIPFILGYRGKLAASNGDVSKAVQFTLTAIQNSVYQQSGSTFLWQWQLARLYEESGAMEKALVMYKLAYKRFQDVRHQLEFSFSDYGAKDIRELFLSYANLAFNTKTVDTRDVIEALESYNQYFLENYYSDTCHLLIERNIDTTQIEADVAIYYPIIFNDRIVNVLYRNGEYKVIPVKFQEGVRGKVNRLEELVHELEKEDELKEISKYLYDLLIGPLEDDLKGVSTLMYIPDELLQGLPIEILYDGTQYLLEKEYSVVVSPGWSLMDSEKHVLKNKKVLFAGISEARDGLNKLNSVIEEAKSIPSRAKLIDEKFTISNLREYVGLGSYSTVHFSSHAVFNDDYQNSYLLTYDGKLYFDEISEMMIKRRASGDPINLAIFSACETAEGKRGQQLGLAGLALKSGARSAIGTLWPVNDTAAGSLMSGFYKYYSKNEMNKAKALKIAKLLVFKDEKKGFSHPFYWSAYQMIGNWY